MTRASPTRAESKLADALCAHLRQVGHTVTDVALEDRPDLRFSLDGVPTACELVQIPPAAVLRYVHTRFKQLEGRGAKAVKVIWPQEQHFWAQSAIESKQVKLSAYKRNAGVQNVSLLVHAPVDERSDWLQSNLPVTRSLIQLGAQRASHSFASVYFWSQHTGVHLIAPSNEPRLTLTTDLTRGYPTHGFVIASSSFKTTQEGEEPVLFDYGELLPDVILVPPQSPDFQGHPANFVNPKLRLKVLARATSADIWFEPVP
jgi:hypothetical protein